MAETQSIIGQEQLADLLGPDSFSPQFTNTGDTLAVLAASYGVSAKSIVQANGIQWTLPVAEAKEVLNEYKIPFGSLSSSQVQTLARVNMINEWVLSRNGKCMPFDPGASLLGRKMIPCASGGYAVFTNESEIMLPEKSRKKITPLIPGAASKAMLSTLAPAPPPSPMMMYGGVALGVVGLLYFLNKKKA